jgi:hypothetical protein
MDVAAVRGEVEDRIADGLARPVVRDVAAAPGLEDLEPLGPERVFREEDVLRAGVAAEGEDGVVLQEQEGVGDPPGLALRDQAGLQLQPLRVGQPAEVPDFQRTYGRRGLG